MSNDVKYSEPYPGHKSLIETATLDGMDANQCYVVYLENGEFETERQECLVCDELDCPKRDIDE